MGEVSSDAAMGRSAGKTPVERLLAAIGYPERMSGVFAPFTLRVDGAEVVAEEMDGRIVLSCALDADDSFLQEFAGYAAGRMLKEDAVLSYGDGRLFLWQDVPADAGARELHRFFETFMDSCDWWRARADALRGGGSVASSAPDPVMIRP